ncbi:unnamed protein product [Protopolystoma xenopodis]|uniref:Kinase n=1 Tax=Protopolystoma xenopodis TaxID=117903 RepID=A0A3S5CS60_9PLAT|nr:unnamed protein product [Protopolystoma xenopodis]
MGSFISSLNLGIRLFLGPDLDRARNLAKAFIAKLSELIDWFETQTQFAFYATSLILAYDAIPTPLFSSPAVSTTTSFPTTISLNQLSRDPLSEEGTTSRLLVGDTGLPFSHMPSADKSNKNDDITLSHSHRDKHKDFHVSPITTNNSHMVSKSHLVSSRENVVLRWVDFTHWNQATCQRDENFLSGLYSLKHYFERAAQETFPLATEAFNLDSVRRQLPK